MKAEEFNRLIAEKINSDAADLGFISSKVHFYLHCPPNIMLLYKSTQQMLFEGYYLVLTHDFFNNTCDEKGRLKLPGYLEKYPVSISLERLTQQYEEHDSIFDFDCDMNFLTREVATTRQRSELDNR